MNKVKIGISPEKFIAKAKAALNNPTGMAGAKSAARVLKKVPTKAPMKFTNKWANKWGGAKKPKNKTFPLSIAGMKLPASYPEFMSEEEAAKIFNKFRQNYKKIKDSVMDEIINELNTTDPEDKMQARYWLDSYYICSVGINPSDENLVVFWCFAECMVVAVLNTTDLNWAHEDIQISCR